MPSDTFLRLSKEKQEKLLSAAKYEFTRVSFAEASINQIIKAVPISRGSFYMYFKNKEDLYSYILDYYLSSEIHLMEDFLKENNGDFFLMMTSSFEQILQFCSFEENRAFLIRVIENTTIYKEIKSRERLRSSFAFEKIEALIHQESLTMSARKHLRILFMEAVHLMMGNLFCYLHHQEAKEHILKDFNEQLELLKYGVLRKEDENV